MEKISNDYRENVRVLDGLLGVGRSCDMVSRDYLIGGRRARLWVVDGFGSDSILERMGAFWLTLKPENVVGLTEMQDFLDRYITFSESNVTFDISDAVTSVFLGKSLLAVEGLAGVALMDAKGYPSRGVDEPPERTRAAGRQGAPGQPRRLCRGSGAQYGAAAPPHPGPAPHYGGAQGWFPHP